MKKEVSISQLTFESSINYCNQVQKLIDDGVTEIELDFMELGTIEPFGIVYFANFIQESSKGNISFTCNYPTGDSISYAKHMGLFQCCRFDIGSHPRKSLPSTSASHIPITIINIENLKAEAIEKNKHVGDIIEEYANNFAKLISALKEGPLVDTLTYCFREITRNVVEHSESKNLVFCAQYWPYLKKAEIVVLDKGKGILESLNENESLPDIDNHKDALNFALLPSISSKVQYGKKTKSSDDFWKNTGFGLYMTHRIASLGGDFFLSSGNHGIRWVNEQKQDYNVNYLKGTVLRIVIKTDQIEELSNTLMQFREDGFKLARSITKMRIEPSRASLMLSRDRTL